MREEIRGAVTKMVSDHAGVLPAPGELHRGLWDDLAATGFSLLGVPEEIGGSGARLGDLAVVVDVAASAAAAVPLAESAFVAGLMLSDTGLRVPDGLTVASLTEATLDRSGGAPRIVGSLSVPWGRHADAVVTLVREGEARFVAVLPAADRTALETAENLAGEPRDVVVYDGVVVDAAALHPTTLHVGDILRRGALARSVQLAGAARGVLEATLRYVAEREQFGRPLARFQAVQQHLAALAGEVAAMKVAADAAVLAVEDASTAAAAEPAAQVAVAAAKAVTSAAAQVVAALGHQLHGALGYTQEHRLGLLTTRLWSWREEFGNEGHWQDHLAAAVAEEGAWWPVVSGGAVSHGAPIAAGAAL